MKDEFLESLLPDGQSLEEALEEQQVCNVGITGSDR